MNAGIEGGNPSLSDVVHMRYNNDSTVAAGVVAALVWWRGRRRWRRDPVAAPSSGSEERNIAARASVSRLGSSTVVPLSPPPPPSEATPVMAVNIEPEAEPAAEPTLPLHDGSESRTAANSAAAVLPAASETPHTAGRRVVALESVHGADVLTDAQLAELVGDPIGGVQPSAEPPARAESSLER